MRRPELASVRLGRAPGIDAEDVMVVITTTEAEEWSFGGGRGN
ncbi:putative tautomerase [Pseudomonas chlororaphis subsp. chlororaphis]|nr:putative tautomerase [Pseudomonas chlororaphis subsp. chlororaphis]